jgi:hypothetical protein
MKDENIYVFICARSNYFGNTFEYSGTYAIAKDANWDNVIDHITEEMNESFEEYLDGINPLPRAGITCMNEISKELYDRLHQEHQN